MQASGVADVSSSRFFTINKFDGTKPKFTFNCSISFSVVDVCGWHVFLMITLDFSYFRLRLLFLAIAFIYVYASFINLLYSECE